MVETRHQDYDLEVKCNYEFWHNNCLFSIVSKHIEIMKTSLIYVVIFMLIGMLNQGCEKNTNDSNHLYHGLTVLPENPTAQNEIMIIEEVSSCSFLRPVIINGNSIEYKRYYDSRIAAPCYLEMDTIPLGQLSTGHYTIMYSLIDLAITTSDSIVDTDEVSFNVTK